ncbi:4-hydroxy-tetrahydrodipicolinate synthase [Pseudoroseomonas cervicalis]|uniref:4-hydroxy-tetrahydrodipicolinate synthase n=1 Tax=Teichococcus cervicalis TaxID=204525 RepID=UPI00278ABC49|nr:4-hydroxy-tetrahydrodipicolinate synthase [Pseudoroseomonas cervicalis]MDQ1078625.1 4-hydroxy-tetrahydrodipicolinate synthase [Pseudoroseomonas cervicalis]
MIAPVLRGLIPALPTPFIPGSGQIDEAALAALAERVVARGASGVVACGSTGEAPALSAAEHGRALHVVAEAVGHRVPVIAGVGAPSTEAAAALAQSAALCGAAALLVSAPPYVRPGQEGLCAHIRAVAAAGRLPLVLYDVPSRAGVGFADDSIARLRDANLIQALKDATADLARPARLARLCGRDFTQLSGDDATAVAHLAMGGSGCVSVLGNLVPALCSALHSAWAAQDPDRVAELRDRLAPLAELLFRESSPVPLKAALGLLRLCDARPRLPLLPATATTRALLAEALAALLPEEEARATAALRPPPRHALPPRLLQ